MNNEDRKAASATRYEETTTTAPITARSRFIRRAQILLSAFVIAGLLGLIVWTRCSETLTNQELRWAWGLKEDSGTQKPVVIVVDRDGNVHSVKR